VILLEINQSRLIGGQRMPIALANRAARAVSSALGKMRGFERAGGTVSVAFVSPEKMKQLNFEYRGKNAITDVLSFPLQDGDTVGEVILSYEKAALQAEERSHSTRDELVFLLVHGLLHVFGFDHERPKDAAHMFPLQASILKSLGVDPRL
jgi:probable rRNA maturation factor